MSIISLSGKEVNRQERKCRGGGSDGRKSSLISQERRPDGLRGPGKIQARRLEEECQISGENFVHDRNLGRVPGGKGGGDIPCKGEAGEGRRKIARGDSRRMEGGTGSGR